MLNIEVMTKVQLRIHYDHFSGLVDLSVCRFYIITGGAWLNRVHE